MAGRLNSVADVAEVRIKDLSHDARGVAELDGRVVFVSGALPGEAVTVEYRTGRRRNKRDLQSLEIKSASPQRIEPHCEHFGRCGGCAVQHMNYDAQIEFKQSLVIEAFHRIGGIEPAV